MTSQQASGGRVTTAMVLWMMLLTFIWGLAAIAAKIITAGIAPAMAAGLRSALALVVLTAFVAYRPAVMKAPRRPLLLATVTGVMLAMDFLFYFSGVKLTTSGQLSVFVNTSPLFVAVGAHFLLPNDRLHPLKSVGLVISFIGVVVLFWADFIGLGGSHWQGNLLVMCSAISWGASTLLIKRFLSDRLTAFQLLYIRLMASTPLILLFSWLREPDPFPAVTPLIIALMAFQAVVVIVFSYMMWLWLLKRYPASTMQSFAVMSPVWAVVLGVLLLGEHVTLSMAAGMVLVGLGLLLVSRPPQGDVRGPPVPPGLPATKP